MIDIVDVQDATSLEDYAAYMQLTRAVGELRDAARSLRRPLEGRTVWMVNSTAQGGGVAEMLPKVVSLMRELGIETKWAVIGTDDRRFFDLTKRIHNLLHGVGDPDLGAEEREVYEAVSREVARALEAVLHEDDLLVVHDPQPLGAGALVKEALGIPTVWRCHIGVDRETPQTRAAWRFLAPWTQPYDHAVFTVPQYVPSFLQDRASIIPPAIDPLSHKNRHLSTHKLSGILLNASLETSPHPVLTPPFEAPAQRLQPDGSFAPAMQPEGIGLLFRPVVLQVSRWDRLKGFGPLLGGFVHLKRHLKDHRELSDRHRRRLELVRLVLAGPDPASVADDPEGLEVFEALCDRWLALDPAIQQDVALVVLPMASRKVNALMVNALQRCATVVAQNSLREGFGLTVTEAMWKGIPVLGTHAVGIREQVRDDLDGCLVDDAENAAEIAGTLDMMLADPGSREVWGRNAQLRVNDHYLVFSQVRRWLELLSAQVSRLAA